MKLTVFSDCHGNLDNAIQILSQCQSDRYLFCGDGIRNAELAADLLGKPLLAVLGNCDRGETGEAERLLELDGVRILLTHGHGYSVKASLLPLRRRALELGAQLVLYGHTHLPSPMRMVCCSAIPAAVWTAPSAPRSNCWMAPWRRSAYSIWIRLPPPCKRKKAPGEPDELSGCFLIGCKYFGEDHSSVGASSAAR